MFRMTPEEVRQALRVRVAEFGKKEAYLLYPEEFSAGKNAGLFEVQGTEDRGDGTVITQVIFEGNAFLLVEES